MAFLPYLENFFHFLVIPNLWLATAIRKTPLITICLIIDSNDFHPILLKDCRLWGLKRNVFHLSQKKTLLVTYREKISRGPVLKIVFTDFDSILVKYED